MDIEVPQYTMSFDDEEGKVTSGLDNPEALNAMTQRVLSSMEPAPEISPVPDTIVKLPAGMVTEDGVVREAEVQELTGEHEEILAKARASGNPAKFVNTLLSCGVVKIGDRKASPAVLASLIQGDLDALLLGIRKATFGSEFEVFGIPCPSCGEANDLKLNLEDIPVKELEDPTEREFTVPLRRGRFARVQFPTGEVQNEIFKKTISIPEMNSITLAECVLGFLEADGAFKPIRGLVDVKNLGIADRRTLQDYIYDNQPGPRYDKITAACHACESEVPVPLNVGILFREL